MSPSNLANQADLDSFKENQQPLNQFPRQISKGPKDTASSVTSIHSKSPCRIPKPQSSPLSSHRRRPESPQVQRCPNSISSTPRTYSKATSTTSTPSPSFPYSLSPLNQISSACAFALPMNTPIRREDGVSQTPVNTPTNGGGSHSWSNKSHRKLYHLTGIKGSPQRQPAKVPFAPPCDAAPPDSTDINSNDSQWEEIVRNSNRQATLEGHEGSPFQLKTKAQVPLRTQKGSSHKPPSIPPDLVELNSKLEMLQLLQEGTNNVSNVDDSRESQVVSKDENNDFSRSSRLSPENKTMDGIVIMSKNLELSNASNHSPQNLNNSARQKLWKWEELSHSAKVAPIPTSSSPTSHFNGIKDEESSNHNLGSATTLLLEEHHKVPISTLRVKQESPQSFMSPCPKDKHFRPLTRLERAKLETEAAFEGKSLEDILSVHKPLR